MLETDQLHDTANLPEAVPLTPDLTRQQLEAIRDEWLGPLLMQMRHQSEEVGRLQVECRQLRDERERLTAERDELKEQLAAKPEADPPPPPTAFELAGKLVAQLRTAEGAVVTGIAIAIGLWFGIGILAWSLLG